MRARARHCLADGFVWRPIALAARRYDVKAPAYFTQRNVGKAIVTRTTGTKIASDGLKGRVFQVSLADLNNDESTYRNIKLVAEEVQGRFVLTNFHGLNFTADKLRSLVKKWQTLIEVRWPWRGFSFVTQQLAD